MRKRAYLDVQPDLKFIITQATYMFNVDGRERPAYKFRWSARETQNQTST